MILLPFLTLIMTLQATTSLKVGVIGGGAAGLAAARVLTRNGHDAVVFEKSPEIGGVWNYKQEHSRDKPMYRGLRTNLPREIMAYREKKWGGGPGKSYVTHQEVLEYLKGYKDQFELDQFILYDSQVTQLTVLIDDESTDSDWPRVRLDWQSNNKECSDNFDAVCICNGHYGKPSSPVIPGMDGFCGKVMHSMVYDDPAEFADQTVLCVGARASGTDLAREISRHAKHVYLSDSTADDSETLGRVTVLPKTIAMKEGNHAQFDKDCPLSPPIDTVIYCSGYDYSFPFINEKSNLPLTVGQRRVMPLYKQLWHAEYPSVAFLGLPHSVLPFPLFELQSEAVLNTLLHHELLPPRQERMEAAKRDAVRGGPNETGRVEDTHYLGAAQWAYCRDLAKMAGLYNDKIENYLSTNQAIYEHAGSERGSMFPGGPDTYRSTCYVRDEDNRSFRVTATEMKDATVGKVASTFSD